MLETQKTSDHIPAKRIQLSGLKLFVLPAVLAFFTLLLVLTGTIVSGFHFVDDHEMIDIRHELKQTPLINVMAQRVIKDYTDSRRFRPVYIMNRVFQVYLFGTHFPLHSLYNLVLMLGTVSFLYLTARKTGFNRLEAGILPLLTMLGEQTALWWKLGTNESIAMFLFSGALFALVASAYCKRPLAWLIGSILLMILSSLAKESFVLLIPVYLFIMVWHNRHVGKEGWTGSIFRHLIPIILLLAVFSAELALVFHAGINWSYAGVEGFHFWKFVKAFVNLFIMGNGALVLLLSAIFAVPLLREKKKGNLISLLPGFMSAFLVILPQVFLYSKSGITERYLIPGVFGYSLLIICFMRRMRGSAGVLEGFYLNRWVKTAGISFFLLVAVSGVLMMASGFSGGLNWLFQSFELVFGRMPLPSFWQGRLLILGVSLFIGGLSAMAVTFNFGKKYVPAVFVFLFALLTAQCYTAVSMGIDFSRDGRHTADLFRAVKKSAVRRSKILIVGETLYTFEINLSAYIYIYYQLGMTNIRIATVKLGNYTGDLSGYTKYYQDKAWRNSTDGVLPDCIIILGLVSPELEPRFIDQSVGWLHTNQYKRDLVAGKAYVIYTKITNTI
jgi:hypothetical protein